MIAIRQIRIEGDIAFVPLTQGYEAVIDAADAPLVEAWDWRAIIERKPNGTVRSVYAARSAKVDGKWRSLRMHRTITATPAGLETDHIDGDGLNNRRSNLRLATQAQNQHNRRIGIDNSSGVKGVYYDKNQRGWRAQIRIHGRKTHLGTYAKIDDAAAAYARASAELHGEFGRTA